jgi:hypothetical protein
MIRKWLAVGIILLFVGVTLAPTINFNAVKASTDDDLVEVTTQAYGIQGYGNTTVKLTREQYKDLEEYLVEFRARLNQTSTREEAIPIFKEAVVELDTYGLLPKGMSVEDVQRKKIVDASFSLVAGFTTDTISFPVFFPFRQSFLNLIYFFNNDLFTYIWAFAYLFLIIRRNFFPLFLSGELSFGCRIDPEHGTTKYIPSKGWVYSIGLLTQNWSGDIYGQIRKLEPFAFLPPFQTFYSGILGFTGLNIFTSSDEIF